MFREEVESGQFNVLLTTYEYIMKDKVSHQRLPAHYRGSVGFFVGMRNTAQ